MFTVHYYFTCRPYKICYRNYGKHGWVSFHVELSDVRILYLLEEVTLMKNPWLAAGNKTSCDEFYLQNELPQLAFSLPFLLHVISFALQDPIRASFFFL